MAFTDHKVTSLISGDMAYAIILLLWKRNIIVTLCANVMIIIDQPVIILTFIDNEYTIISLILTINIHGCHCVIVW